jgi:DNA-binding SARP family transcriptional activator
VRLHTTGSFAAHSTGSGKDITPRGRKACALLAYLTSNGGQKVSKGRVAAMLWGDRGDPQARASLRQVLRELRVGVDESDDFVSSDREHVWLSANFFTEDPAEPAATLKHWFEDLDDITPEFDDWLAGERSRRGAAEIGALQATAGKLLAEGRGAESAVVVDQIQALDPCNEDALSLGMEADFLCGHSGGIAERYLATAAHLKTDLGVDPSAATRDMRDRLIDRLTKRPPAIPLHETDHQFFVRRAREENTAAATSNSENVREVHEALGKRYEDLAESLG